MIHACGVLVTRPSRLAAMTLHALRTAGHHAEHLPLLNLTPLKSPELEAALARYPEADFAIFVSANAAEFGIAALAANKVNLAGPRIAAIGSATAAALGAAGLNVDLVPEDGHDSEALLKHPALQDVKGRVILLFRGESEGGGRRTIAETLASRGAEVVPATCYRREPAQHAAGRIAEIAAAIKSGRLNAIQVMSIESLDALQALFSDLPELRACLVIVPHERIAEATRAAGFPSTHVIGLGDDALIAALAAHGLDPSACHARP